MDTAPLSPAAETPFVPLPDSATLAQTQAPTVQHLLENVDETLQSLSRTTDRAGDYKRQLAERRLGIASSLFLALRAKHAASAAHCMRVALACSAWATAANLSQQERDDLEIAALLHDIGKIGVPDSILLKPHKLEGDEALQMERHRQYASEILSACCGSDQVIEILRHSGAWYDGSKKGYDRAGTDLPIGARMLSIVDAYDSMTTDHVYRRAMSRERAMAELFECAGGQFDPQLVNEFAQLISSDENIWTRTVARRWLQQLQPDDSHVILRSFTNHAPRGESTDYDAGATNEFEQRLLENMHDGVMFVDREMKILQWNRAAERLTGIPSASVLHKQFVPSLLHMQMEDGAPVSDSECPIANAVTTGIQSLKRMRIMGRKGRRFTVNMHLVPVLGAHGQRRGAAVILHDASSQITLEERVQMLHQRATQDPLTKVANRAEFDRVLAEFVDTHLREGAPCSLIICDIDHFKKINDTHGHQAGDEALVSFASVLRSCCRPGDLVARYGGEEFVMLCADCDNATATRRAEEVRRTIAATPQSMLGGRCITASFGVTEIQAGDTPETMLRRADRALLQAKDHGRNRVVQLGTGMYLDNETAGTRRRWWSGWLRGSTTNAAVERQLATSVPISLAVEKLRGFISDQHAEILELEQNRILLKIDGPRAPLLRRHSDRAEPFFIEMQFSERMDRQGGHGNPTPHTIIHVSVRAGRRRDRRTRDIEQRALQLLVSLKAYFMAHENEPDPAQGETNENVDIAQKLQDSPS